MKGKFIKKLMAYALAAAMVVSTPMTAFATEFSDNFSVSDGVDGNGNDDTDTGTVSNTHTGTTTLKDYWECIDRIRINESSDNEGGITMRVGAQKELTATILYKPGQKPDEETQRIIESQIRWRSGDNKVVAVDAKLDTMTVCPINAKSVGNTTVTAGLDFDVDGEDDAWATVYVNVIDSLEAIDSIAWNTDALAAERFYAGHTYNLNNYLLVNDEPYVGSVYESVLRIAYATDADSKKEASITQIGAQNDDGENAQLAQLKVSRAVKENTPIKIVAKFANEDADNIFASLANDGSTLETIDEKEATVAEITLLPGVPATKLWLEDLNEKKVTKGTVDFGELYDDDGDQSQGTFGVDYIDNSIVGGYGDDVYPVYPLKVIAGVPDGYEPEESTEELDEIKVKNPAVADVAFDNGIAYVYGKEVGKTTITFIGTSGKKASFNVTVDATLKAIWVNDSINTWSGKTTKVEPVIERRPNENKDKLKITVASDAKKLIKVKNMTIVPVAYLKAGGSGIETTLTVSLKKKGKTVTSDEIPVYVSQSDVTFGDDSDILRLYYETGDAGKVGKTETFTYLNPNNDYDDYMNWHEDNQDAWSGLYYVSKVYSNTMTKEEAFASLSWVSSNPSVVDVEPSDDEQSVNIYAAGKTGSAKITVSCVGQNKSGKYKTYKKSFTVKCTPVCDELTLKSYEVANIPGQKVTLSVKQLLPKKTVDQVKWYIDGVYDKDDNFISDGKDIDFSVNKSTRKFVCTIPQLDKGDVIKVRVESGIAPSVIAQIHVLGEKTKKVQFTEAVNGKMNLDIGQLAILSPDVDNGDVITGYSINKHGVVKVLMLNDRRAIVCGIGKGAVTVTAKMASGKTVKVKITVSENIYSNQK